MTAKYRVMKIKVKMNRRKFLKLTATGLATTGAAALMVHSDRLFNASNAQDVKKIFLKCGACSHTFFYILNREFGYPKEDEERASDPLAGGLLSNQHQCGMLWGSVLAAGAESFRRHQNQTQAIAAAITAAQRIMESFSKRTKAINCRDITGDFNNKIDTAMFMLKSLPGGMPNFVCMNIAEKWASEAVQSAREGLSYERTDLPQLPINCATEVARKMGASDEEMIMAAGFAGGMGLSGNACGALGAAIWINTLAWCREHRGKSGNSNPKAKEILKTFYNATGSEILCSKISGQSFKSIDDHTEFIKTGGCKKVVNVLASS